MKTFTFVLVLMSLSSSMQAASRIDLCDIKTKSSEVLSAFKSDSSREAMQKFLIALQTSLASESQSLLEKETLKNWSVLKKLETDKEDSKHMRDLSQLLNENDPQGKGFLFNVCGFAPEVEQVVAKMKAENQALVRDLFEVLRVRVNEELPGVYEMVKNSNSHLVEKMVKLEPDAFKKFNRMFLPE